MRRLSAMTAILFLAVGSSLAVGEEPFADMKYEDALKAAEKGGKIVLIDFYTTWCVPCKELDKTTWKDEKVRKWLAEKTIALKIDAEKSKDLAKKLKIEAYPTIVLLKPDEAEIDRLVGYRDAKTFLSEVKDALAGKDSVTRAKEGTEGDKKNDPMARMQYAKTLAQKGKNEEALKEFLWCYDHGAERSPAFSGVRLSFLVSDIANLGLKYPPALEELRVRRDGAEKVVRKALDGDESSFDGIKGRAVFDATMELNALNRALGDTKKTLEVFDRLGKRGSKTASIRQLLLSDLLDILLEARRYGDIAQAAGDVVEDVDQSIERYNEEVRRGQKTPYSAAEYMKKSALETGGKYYEAALGAKKLKTASKIAKKLVTFDKSGETYAMLIEHAVRAKQYPTARKLAKQAEKNLEKDEVAAARAAAKKIPKKEKSSEQEDQD